MAKAKSKSSEVYFFVPEGTTSGWKTSASGISEDGFCYVPDKDDFIKLAMQYGLDQYGKGIPVVTFKGHKFIRTDWMKKMVPETTDDMEATEKALRKIYKDFINGVKAKDRPAWTEDHGTMIQG